MKTFEIFEKYISVRKSIVKVEHVLTTINTQLELDDTKFYSIYLCLHEAFINAIYHGNLLDNSKYVELYVYVEDDVLTIQITDQGEGVEVSKLPNPLNVENFLKDSGRGIFLICHYTDNVKFEKNQRGFHVIMHFNMKKNDDTQV
ncbi:Anti-sigma F factor [bioreactor metagenome]|uniref:Anti-sigma F factor n=1 Tax=bioreactor metagenome TaxID=1076179 RepID=A0A645B9G0_9ZZZZ